MRQSNPPVVATWLLRHFISNEALAGDVVEEYRRGRSNSWYWKQVVVGIIASTANEVRLHKLLTLRALVIGWAAALLLYEYGLGPLQKAYLGLLFRHGFRNDYWWRHYYFYPALLPLFICLFASGWIVARCHRRHERAMVLVYLFSLEVYLLHDAFRLVVDTLGDRRFLPYFVSMILNAVMAAVFVLAGGLVASSGRSELRGVDRAVVS